MRSVLESLGFKQSYSDAAIYVMSKGDLRIILPVFVDDMTFVSQSLPAIEDIIAQLRQHFKLRDLGPTTQLLGIKIDRDHSKHTISLSQHHYCLDILQRFGMADCKPVTTPMDPGLRLSHSQSPQTTQEATQMRSIDYLGAVGVLMYLVTSTRPDIAYAVGVLARFNANPGLAHWNAVKHLFHYLKGTAHFALTYGPDSSSSGLFVWLRNLLEEMGFSVSSPSILHTDNQSAIQVAKIPEHHGRMKHLNLRWFWLRDVVDQGLISPVFVPTTEMPADLLTKPLARVKVQQFCEMLGLAPSWGS